MVLCGAIMKTRTMPPDKRPSMVDLDHDQSERRARLFINDLLLEEGLTELVNVLHFAVHQTGMYLGPRFLKLIPAEAE